MLDFIKEVRILLVADATLASYVGDRIYLASKPIKPRDVSIPWLPQITMRMDDGSSDAQFGVCYPTFYIDIWVSRYCGYTSASQIGELVVKLLNGQHLTSGELEVYRIQKNASTIIYEDESMLWHRTITFDIVMDDVTEPQG